MQFLDRQEELRRLDALLRRPEGGLAVVYGRRRLGKTRLLVEWCRRRGGVYSVADESTATLQRRFFAAAISVRFPGFGDVEYPEWAALLRRLSDEAKHAKWRGPLVIDELPYLVQTSPELPSILQRWIDHEARSAKLGVVVSGSSQAMMQGLVLDANAPLYGRAREVFAISPLAPRWIQRAYGRLSAKEAVEHYAVWGGTPRYWELADELGAASLEEALDRLVLDPSGPLHLEPDRLLREEQPPAISLRPILDAIGLGAHRLSEIAGRVGQPATSMSRPLQRLIDLGLVERESPFGESEKSHKRSLYRIADPFFRFWFRVVGPNRSALAQATPAARLALWKRHRDALVSGLWEDLCRRAVPRLRRGPLRAAGPWETARRYWLGSGPEWDVVSRTLDGEHVLVGEVKWRASRVTLDDFRAVRAALEAKGLPHAVSGSAKIHRVIFLPSRPPKVSSDGPLVVDARDVLAAL